MWLEVFASLASTSSIFLSMTASVGQDTEKDGTEIMLYDNRPILYFLSAPV